MIGEIWTYIATKPNDNLLKVRPILIIGDDMNNELQFVDIHYAIISSSSTCGKYDINISEGEAKRIGLQRKSIIKTTKIYTGSKTRLGNKIGKLPENIKKEFIKNYEKYQINLIKNLVKK